MVLIEKFEWLLEGEYCQLHREQCQKYLPCRI